MALRLDSAPEKDAAMDIEELEPRKTKPQPKNLDPLSVEELTDYIADLKTEIARVEEKIAAKRAHLNAVSGLFKSK
jgi:uncharacterized small protein (DUF1192 family)